MTNGVVYLNAGTGCCARLLVSIRTLRKVYQGRVHVHSFGEGWEIVEKIGKKKADTILKILDKKYS